MKTLVQAAIDFERTQSLPDSWNAEVGNPYLVSSARDAFMAGAAAMAEIFASGQGVKIEQAPRKYFLEYKGEAATYRWIVLAYNLNEALRQLGLENAHPTHIRMRAATPEDEKLEDVIRA